MTKENKPRSKTKKVVIQLEDWIDNVEAWEENIYAFMVYGKDLLKFMVEQHPETKQAFMEARKTPKGKMERSPDYPCMVSFTDGEYFDQQIETGKRQAEIKALTELKNDG
tara:strand:+ start:720 stop:1049 length:330 start_codon:yes stop_codon:yes gene_type:complete